MKINDLCMGCKCCSTRYPETFKIVDGKSTIIDDNDIVEPSICPVGAIEE